MKLNKILVALISSGYFVSGHAVTTGAGETYEQSYLSTSNKPINSCLTGIDVTSKQIVLSGADIQGPLPFSRTYNTTLQLDYKPEFRNEEGKSLDGAFAVSYLENRAFIGLGWSHNYDYRLITFGNPQFNIYRLYILSLPGESYPITLRKQPDNTYKVISNVNDTNPSPDIEFSVTDDDSTNITVKRKGVEYTFKALSGARNITEQFYLTKIKYPGGKTIDLTYSSYTKATLTVRVLTDVADNLGNKLKISYINFDGSDTSALGQKLRGLVSSVTTNSNTLNKQTVTYTYEPVTYHQNGSDHENFILTKAVSTANGTEDYSYNKSYVHKGLYSDSQQTVRGVAIPIISGYSKQGTPLRAWEANDNSISSYTDKTKDLGVLKFTEDFSQIVNDKPFYQKSTLTLTPPSPSTTPLSSEVFTVENGSNNEGPAVAYLATSAGPSCLTYDGKPVKSLLFKKDIRQLTRVVDKNNNRTDFQYDNKNRLTNRTEAVGSTSARTTTATYTTDFDIPSTVQRGNITQTNTINTLGQITKSTLTSSQTGSTAKATDYTYLANGLLSTVDGPRTGTTDKVTYTYDAYGNKASEAQVVNSATRTTSYVGYNSFGQPERIVYPTGLVDKFVYNADGTVASKTTGTGTATTTITGKTTTYTYDTLKRLSSETNPDGEKTSYIYDVKDQVIKTTLPDGSLVNKTYHGNGAIASEKLTDSTGATIFTQSSTTLDANGRLLKTVSGTDATKNWVTNTYDLNGNLTQTASALGITEKWTYDPLNRVTSHTDGLGNIDKKTYDLQDSTLTALDALNAGTNPYSYRNGKVLTKEVNTDYGTKSYTYNEADLLTQSLYGTRKCDNLNIDALERVGQTACTNSAATTPATLLSNLSFSYDQTRFGRLDKVTSADTAYGVDTVYTYDAYDRIVGKSQTNKTITTWTGTKPTLAVAYAYTIGDKLSTLTLPSGRKLAYTYDTTKKNLLTNVTLDGTALIRAITYDAGGQMTGWNWGAGAASYTWTYDAVKNGVIQSISNKNNSGVVNYSLAYAFDNDGRVSKITRNNGLVDSFTYSNADRLLTESRLNGTTSVFGITYTYDKNGNRLSLAATGTHQQPQANVAYTYTGNKLATIAGVAATHTANAELIYGGFTPTYDNTGNRREDKTTGGAATAPQYYMTYNHKNERTVRGYTANSTAWKANAVQFVYDENSHLIGEYNADGVPLVEYVWLGDKPVAAIYGSGTTAKTYWIATDAQNTPRRLIDAADGTTTVWAWDSTAFGVGLPSVQTVKFNLRFPGQYYDEVTKQHYNHNRFYNPVLGRYMEADPTGLQGGLNPYIYANGNPISTVDPTGLDFEIINSNLSKLQRDESANLNALNDFLFNVTYAFNDTWTFGLWGSFNNWYYGGSAFDPTSAGAYLGGLTGMVITGPSKIGQNIGQNVAIKAEPYAVGAYNEVKGLLKGYDAHHVGQAKVMEKLIPGYNRKTAPAILVPQVGHTTAKPGAGIVARNVSGLSTPRGVIARDIKELRRVYPDIPNSQLQYLINMNKAMYPTYFKKKQ
ncbi:RHS repeat-associated core domain-containing protein [Acinetobacter pittii]|uniref:RHS repeat-associated core domain-containing protein n=1 Tax=Acinetobacter pittii TaxID=48296 RepID=UPI0009BC942F|nr:RHS repeat-associated core domain-containing protein [Acinetobacter pittii]